MNPDVITLNNGVTWTQKSRIQVRSARIRDSSFCCCYAQFFRP